MLRSMVISENMYIVLHRRFTNIQNRHVLSSKIVLPLATVAKIAKYDVQASRDLSSFCIFNMKFRLFLDDDDDFCHP